MRINHGVSTIDHTTIGKLGDSTTEDFVIGCADNQVLVGPVHKWIDSELLVFKPCSSVLEGQTIFLRTFHNKSYSLGGFYCVKLLKDFVSLISKPLSLPPHAPACYKSTVQGEA